MRLLAVEKVIQSKHIYDRQETTFQMIDSLAASIRHVEVMMWWKLALHVVVLAAMIWMIVVFNRWRRKQDRIIDDQDKVVQACLALSVTRSALDEKVYKDVHEKVEKTADEVKETIAKVEGVVNQGPLSDVFKSQQQ